MKILVVDDEQLARKRITDLVAQLPDYEVVAEAATGAQALELAEAVRPDLVLLDIRMPGMDGLETARHLAGLEHPPLIVFATAYDEHALEAFETNAVDYVLKPFRRERLHKALHKAKRLSAHQLNALRSQTPLGKARSQICSRHRGKLHLIPVHDVLYFMADQKYVTVRHSRGETLIEESLRSLEEEFGELFVRIHRNALVARAYLAGMEKTADGQHLARLRGLDQGLEISRRHAPQIRQLLKGG